jgi:hypothetical protein
MAPIEPPGFFGVERGDPAVPNWNEGSFKVSSCLLERIWSEEVGEVRDCLLVPIEFIGYIRKVVNPLPINRIS